MSRTNELKQQLRETAERCYRLARTTTDLGAKANLIEMAREADREIAHLEAQQVAPTTPAERVDAGYPLTVASRAPAARLRGGR